MKIAPIDPTVPTRPVEPPYAETRSALGWLAAELWDHLWPWSRRGFAQQRFAYAASASIAVSATLAWLLAGTGRLPAGGIIGWWFGWSVYEVLVRLQGKRHVKDGPWWGRQYRVANVMDMLSYVGFKNLLIGAALFLALKSLGGLVV